jgi:hypothetical protein
MIMEALIKSTRSSVSQVEAFFIDGIIINDCLRENIMIKHLLINLTLVSFSFSQGITLGPFMLGEGVKESRAVCESMALVEEGALGDKYTAEVGNKYDCGWELLFWDNKLDYITMVYNNYSRQAYEDLVISFSRQVGRSPDQNMVFESNYTAKWKAPYRELGIIYISEKGVALVRLNVSYLNE